MSIEEALASRDRAVALVEAHASDEWKDVAYRAVVHIARTRRTFTSDDVWEAIAEAYPHVTTHEHRAMGPVLMGAVRAGICVIQSCAECGTKKVMTTSRRTVANGSDTPVYRSLLHGGAS